MHAWYCHIPWLGKRLCRPPQPKRPTIKRIEETMSLKYTLSLPPLGAADVVERVIHTSVNGSETAPETVPASQTGFTRTFNDNDEVEIWVNDKDDAGNLSPNGAILSFTAIDTIPPNPPAAPSIVSIDEEADTEPPVTPPVV